MQNRVEEISEKEKIAKRRVNYFLLDAHLRKFDCCIVTVVVSSQWN